MAHPIKQLQPVSPTSPKGKDRTQCRLLAQHILCERRQALDALSHVRDAAGEIDPNPSPRPDHAVSAKRINRARTAASMAPSK